MSGWVFDSSAVLAFLRGERGGDRVAAALAGGSISTVNYCEVATKLVENGDDSPKESIAALALAVIPFDAEQAADAAALRPLTRHRGLSLGDRACLALARAQGRAVLTGDRNWEGLEVGVVIELIR